MSDAMTVDTPDLHVRTILITGAGDGLGAALARGAGTAGAEVILLGRTVHKLETVYDAIVADGGPQPAIYPLDLEGATAADYAELADRIDDQCGHLDAVIHNAAMLGPQTPLEHYDPLEWARVLQVNLTAPMLLTQAVIPLLRTSRDAVVLFLGEQRQSAYWGAYGVSKAGVNALAQILRDELAGNAGIRVEYRDPGPMRTPMRRKAFPGALPDEIPAAESAVPAILARLGGG
ncbi:MAG: SDR family NAD(P)-dependent oxidoreductase [Halofilum sp. (in: g-proteobacteria)]